MSPPALTLGPDKSGRQQPRSWAERILWTLVGIVILNWSVTLFGPATTYWPVAVLVILSGFWGMTVAIISWLDLDEYPALERWRGVFEWGNAVLVVVLIGVWTYLQYHNQPAYTTDELSFDQYAAQLVAHGLHNPYLHSMAPAGPMFRLSPDGYTYTVTGHPVLQLSYPSLSFLIYVPFILLGWTNEVGAAVNMMGWVAAALLMFWLLPRSVRPAVLVFSSITVYLSFAAGGVTDMLFIPLLIVSAYRWDRFGLDRRSYLAPVALGLAMAIKQTPWPVLVFVLCALACDEWDRSGDLRAAGRRAGRYLAVTLGVFLLPNLPYVIASPSAWISGVFVPFVKNIVPAGQGIVSLTLFAHLGGGSLTGYTVIFAVIALLLVVVFVGTYPLLRPATFMLPSIAYFFASRSQTNYLISLLPVAIVGAVTAGPAVRRVSAATGTRLVGLFRRRAWGWGAGGLCVLGLIAAIYTFSSSSPLQITVTGEQTTGYLGGIHTLLVRVHNTTHDPVTPGYTVQTSGGFSAFWNIAKGPKTLAPGQAANLVLDSPNYPAEPGLSGVGFSVVGFTDGPATISESPGFLLNLWRTATIPQAFDRPIPVGQRISVRVQVLSHLNSAIHRAGIPVYLGQQMYRSFGTPRGTAKIDGIRPRRRSIVAYTNGQGTATFHIVGTKSSVVPITFSAHLYNVSRKYVYGSSGFLNITFNR